MTKTDVSRQIKSAQLHYRISKVFVFGFVRIYNKFSLEKVKAGNTMYKKL